MGDLKFHATKLPSPPNWLWQKRGSVEGSVSPSADGSRDRRIPPRIIPNLSSITMFLVAPMKRITMVCGRLATILAGRFLAIMKTFEKKAPSRSQESIDRRVISQSENDSAWEAPVRIKRAKPASLSIPGDLEHGRLSSPACIARPTWRVGSNAFCASVSNWRSPPSARPRKASRRNRTQQCLTGHRG